MPTIPTAIATESIADSITSTFKDGLIIEAEAPPVEIFNFTPLIIIGAVILLIFVCTGFSLFVNRVTPQTDDFLHHPHTTTCRSTSPLKDGLDDMLLTNESC